MVGTSSEYIEDEPRLTQKVIGFIKGFACDVLFATALILFVRAI